VTVSVGYDYALRQVSGAMPIFLPF
jgi:hypothetical protein